MSDTGNLDEPTYDLVVAGGGPAGAATATFVAQCGHRVLLLERQTEPHFKIGESLMPATYWIFQRLGVLDRMRQSAFPAKGSVQFFSGDGRASAPFYFEDHDPHESSRTWQVLRSDFDEILLTNAAEQGVEPHPAPSNPTPPATVPTKSGTINPPEAPAASTVDAIEESLV